MKKAALVVLHKLSFDINITGKLLTAPSSATPDPIAITVGTMLNFPACKTKISRLMKIYARIMYFS